DYDHEKLWIGRRCLNFAMKTLEEFKADFNIALLHHPLDWLNSDERAIIKMELQSKVDFILYGHVDGTNVERVAGLGGTALYFAAGARSKTGAKRAFYATVDG